MKRYIFVVFFLSVCVCAVVICGGDECAMSSHEVKRPLRSILKREYGVCAKRPRSVSFSEELAMIGYAEKSESDYDTEEEPSGATIVTLLKDESKPDYNAQMRESFEKAKADAIAAENKEPLNNFLNSVASLSLEPCMSERDRAVMNIYKELVSNEIMCLSFRDEEEPLSGEAFDLLLEDAQHEPVLLDKLLTQFSPQSSQYARLSEAREALDLL